MKTKVRGIRASQEFWDKLNKVAKLKGTTVNAIVLATSNKYCNKVLTSKKSCDKL